MLFSANPHRTPAIARAICQADVRRSRAMQAKGPCEKGAAQNMHGRGFQGCELAPGASWWLRDTPPGKRMGFHRGATLSLRNNGLLLLLLRTPLAVRAEPVACQASPRNCDVSNAESDARRACACHKRCRCLIPVLRYVAYGRIAAQLQCLDCNCSLLRPEDTYYWQQLRQPYLPTLLSSCLVGNWTVRLQGRRHWAPRIDNTEEAQENSNEQEFNG